MKKTTKIWLTIASSLVVIGLILFVAVMTVNHWDFTRLSTVHFETNTYEFSEEFNNIQLNTETADILFAVSDDNTCRVVCYEEENMKHSVRVENDTLTISVADDRAWYEHIGFSFQSPKITIYLPKTEYASLSIKESTGNVEIPGGFLFDESDLSLSTGDVLFSADVCGSLKIKISTGEINVKKASLDHLELSVSTGDITLSEIRCRNIVSSGSTGNIYLDHVNAEEKISIERSTGDVIFKNSDAAEIYVKTSTGGVSGSLMTGKTFVTETSTGKVDVPASAAGGKCEIVTSTGDIVLAVEKSQ